MYCPDTGNTTTSSKRNNCLGVIGKPGTPNRWEAFECALLLHLRAYFPDLLFLKTAVALGGTVSVKCNYPALRCQRVSIKPEGASKLALTHSS